MTEETKKEIKAFAEAIWDATFSKEVGTRWVILQEAKKRGVKLDRELKKYGNDSTNVERRQR